MTIQNKELKVRWKDLTLMQQMANIGSEISRALNWRKKGNVEYSQKAVNRALELLSLTIECNHRPAANREVAWVKEVVIDYFYGENEFSSTELQWRRYFDPFNYAARKINGKL